jgi:LPXTG-site transpeptidase (sortase) family protein
MRRLAAAVVVAAVLALAGCATGSTGAPVPTTTTEPSAPTRVSVPAIGVASELMPLGLDDGQNIEVPPVEEPMLAGWFTDGPSPGEVGPAVILGHVNGGGQAGVFARLAELRAGDEVLVTRADGQDVRFEVRRVRQVPKSDFPTDEVYGDTEDPQLRLITCGGEFDTRAGSYRDNVIVFAVAVPA